MEKISFFLMGKKGYMVLNDFINKFGNEKIEYVVISRDINVINDYFEELESLCKQNSLKYFEKNDVFPSYRGFKFAVGWRWLIRDSENLIVIHDSLLPKYRGFAPLVNMLINSEKTFGVTALFASEEYDRGEIIMQRSMDVEYPVKINTIIDKISLLYSELVLSISEDVFSNNPILSKSQSENDATYSLWRDEEDYIINWNNESKTIQRFINAVGYPFKGATTYLKGEQIIIEDAETYPDVKIENRDAGKVVFVVDKCPVVVCGNGLLKITKGHYVEDNTPLIPLNGFRYRFGK
ncbi:MAG: hypothetical protein K0R18_694 [Bacillales bacterium]|jgi:methionyl-tRNA formyltransferase|nr:hypothetical protein [Bacillales bacterium]